jgi:TolB-like protein/tRNA A-37 threonylcarbamoyl transferase component Bud32/Flp pilus assembly protein TadD
MTDTARRLSEALADRYRIERELGQGGMATVYLAYDLKHDRRVAVKVLKPELAAVLGAERFLAEIKVTANLQHPNLLPLFDSGAAGEFLYYVMPYVEGETLRARIERERQLPVEEVIRLVPLLANALDYAHARGIIHRDLKPENILLQAGQPVIADFGIALAVAQAGGSRVTETGLSLGTPHYMSPEQAAGDRGLDARSDQFALAAVTYEMLAGEPPHTGPTSQAIIARLMTERPRSLRATRVAVPPSVDLAVARALNKSPADRFASCGAFAEALVARPASRRRLAGLIAGAGLILLAVVAWALLRGGRSAPPQDAEQSLAVLPLANLSGDPADDYFGIGLAEEMTRAIAQTGVRVIGRVSAGALQARGLDERAIARELGVTSLLTGTVQRSSGQVRISVTLVSANDGAVRWSERYDRPLENVFAVQDEIASTVAATLLGSLNRPAAATTRRAETTDPEAHSLFLQGQVLFNRRGARNLQQAIVLFERAAARDPKYARAQASLAMALAVLPAYVLDSTPEILTSAVAAAERAIAMDSTIPESYTALGYSYSLLGELAKADLNFRRALALDSTVATTWGWYGLLANRLGEYRDAHMRIERGGALEPASMIARIWEAQILQAERRFAEADSVSSATMAMDSTFMLAWTWRANALLALGEAARAVPLLERQVAMLPPGRPDETHGLLAYAYALAGRTPEARAMIVTIRERSGGRLPAVGSVAAALEELGDHEAAVALLGKAIDRSDTWTVQFPNVARYDRLRKDPRAAAMLARLTVAR